jgi:hypothetical protein
MTTPAKNRARAMIGAKVCDKCGSVRRLVPPKGSPELAQFLIRIVADVTGVSATRIKARGRGPSETVARSAACYVLYHHGGLKWRDVAHAIGKRDHSTAMNMRRHFESAYVLEAISLSVKAYRAATGER